MRLFWGPEHGQTLPLGTYPYTPASASVPCVHAHAAFHPPPPAGVTPDRHRQDQDKEWSDEGQCSRYSELSYIADRGTQRRAYGESEPCFGVTAACPPNMGSQHILYYMRTLCPPLGIPRQTDHSHAFCRPGHTSMRAWKSKLCFGATAACPPNMGSQCVFYFMRALCAPIGIAMQTDHSHAH